MPALRLDAFEAVPKTYLRGTGRTTAPARTMERVRPMLKGMGITRVADVTGLDRIGIPVVMACRPNSRSLSVFQGKGIDRDAAYVSGVMEAIETFHGETIARPLRFESADALGRVDPVVDGATLPGTAEGCFHPGRPMHWIEGYDVVSDSSVWVPYEVVHTDYSTSAPPASGCFRISTNGLASGNHVLEAVSHGLCEVIERDATTLWNFLDARAKQASELLLESVDDEVCRELIARCERAGLTVRAWDATPDLGVPVYVAELREASLRRGAVWGRAAFGSGCHPARQIALSRALTEAAQARTTFIAGARDDMSWDDYESDDGAPLAERVGAVGEPPPRAFATAPTFVSDTVNDDVRWLLERLGDAGLEQAIVVDLTRDDLNLPVVRVVVPGLEGPDEHFEDYVPGPRAQALAEREAEPA